MAEKQKPNRFFDFEKIIDESIANSKAKLAVLGELFYSEIHNSCSVRDPEYFFSGLDDIVMEILSNIEKLETTYEEMMKAVKQEELSHSG